MFIDLSLDAIENVSKTLVEDVLSNKGKDISYRYTCPKCGNSLPVRSAELTLLCPCGGLMTYTDNSLKEYRQRKNLSQSQLANMFGVTRNYISMIENGERPMPRNLKKAIGGNN